MASSITRIECGICLEEYNTTRRPRTLPCGHNFCGGCLQNCIEQGSNSCSICRKTHTATTVDDIPINTEFETVIQLTRSLIAGNNARSNESSDEDDDFTNGRCPKHKKSLLYFKCNSHGIDVCHQCTVIEHSPSKCNIIEIKEEVMKTKENTLADAQQRVDHLDSATTTLEKIIEEKKESNTKKQSQIECILKEIDEDNKICDLALKDIFENKNIKRQIQECIKSLKMSTKNKKIKKDTSELQVKIETLGILLEELKDKYDIEDCSKDLLKNSWSHITINSLKEMVTNSTEEVWASVNMRNQTYSAQISKRKGNLLIKSLSKRIPPENAVTIPVSYIYYPCII
ncbi:unnamed protein product [Meganyctiphanes norvegica]|uniref:RING-type domain-containing protein n=1 Tax=Meganyctiphanes norvegica TaxID=48144 RepID=A0AAV2S8U3_MEGNR